MTAAATPSTRSACHAPATGATSTRWSSMGRVPITFPSSAPSVDALAGEAPQAVVVDVDGELDRAALPEVVEQLDQAIAARPQEVVVDLEDCSFVDATGLAALVEAHRSAVAGAQSSFSRTVRHASCGCCR